MFATFLTSKEVDLLFSKQLILEIECSKFIPKDVKSLP